MDQLPDIPKKRGRGRPKGSLNKKTVAQQSSQPPSLESARAAVPVSISAASVEPERTFSPDPIPVETPEITAINDAPEIDSVADLGPDVELDSDELNELPQPPVEEISNAGAAELSDIWGKAEPVSTQKSSDWEPLRPSRRTKARQPLRLPVVNRSIFKSIPVMVGLAAIVVGLLLFSIRAIALRGPATKVVKTDDIVARVSRLVILPTDEAPIIKTVVDESKVSQPFLQHAQNGDRILVFTKSNRAIIYRPSEDKIVDIGTVTVNPAANSTSPTPEPIATAPASSTATVALWNGGTTVGITSVYEQNLPKSVSGLTISEKQQAVGQNYAQTIVIDLTGKTDKAKEIAAALHATVAALPAGEIKPNADVLVIFGKDIKQ